MKIVYEHYGLFFAIEVDGDQKARLVHFSSRPYRGEEHAGYYPLIELHCLGEDTDGHHGLRHTHTYPAADMRYVSHRFQPSGENTRLEIVLSDGRLDATVFYEFYAGAPVVRCWNKVINRADKPVTLDYVTSFAYYGLTDEVCGGWENNTAFYIAHNTWHGELQWRKNTPFELGLTKVNRSSLKRLTISQLGSWSSYEYLPMGVFENLEDHSCLFWQIEHNGSWGWECSDVPGGGLYLQLYGPNFSQHHFEKVLQKGKTFTSVPVAVGVRPDGFEGVVGALTAYRRKLRRPNADNRDLPVIFNDYMNCLMGDPTEERELPLIDAAAEAGCEYFVIDAGWFSQRDGGDDDWWSSLGVWKEAKKRFPRGLRFLMDYIREKGMVPGLWIELEDIGKECEALASMPDDWFFQRHGVRVQEHGRYQLDFRHPGVRAFAHQTVDELVKLYNVGYLKMDYNITAGAGTDYQADSVGDGLLEHNRAFLCWLDEVLEKYPQLVIENCASGGMRMDYAMLQRLSVQSTSDQTDYRQYACIAAMAATAAAPEQQAIWSYPRVEGDEEETVFNMVNAMLFRVHQSGFLNRLPESSFRQVKEGLACYKRIRNAVREGLPVFPLGQLPLHAPWAAYGVRYGRDLYLSVWRIHSPESTVRMPLECLKGKAAAVTCLYPQGLPVSFNWKEETGEFAVTLDTPYTARLFHFVLQQEED